MKRYGMFATMEIIGNANDGRWKSETANAGQSSDMIDSGASARVCGQARIAKFFEKSGWPILKESDKIFRFGDGNKVQRKGNIGLGVTLISLDNGAQADASLRADVIAGRLTLLIAHRVLMSWKCALCLGANAPPLQNKRIKLRHPNTGHILVEMGNIKQTTTLPGVELEGPGKFTRKTEIPKVRIVGIPDASDMNATRIKNFASSSGAPWLTWRVNYLRNQAAPVAKRSLKPAWLCVCGNEMEELTSNAR